MKTETMLGLMILGIIISVVLAGLRILLLIRQDFRSKLDLIGTISMGIAAAFAVFSFAIWCDQAVQILQWTAKGYDEYQIRQGLSNPTTFKNIFAGDFATLGALWFPKVAFLAAYSPAYRAFEKKLRLLFHITIAVTILTFVGSIATFVFYCFPVSRNWDLTPPKGTEMCIIVVIWNPIFIACLLNIISDIFVLAVPVVALLQIPGPKSRTQRFGVGAIIGLGILSIGMSFYRMLGAKLDGYTNGKLLPIGERNWHIIGNLIMVVSSLIAFSLPSLRALVRKRLKNNRSRFTGTVSSEDQQHLGIGLGRAESWKAANLARIQSSSRF
ncbi:hypothetical protein FPQ18DRAFT_354393 [Pyronema domesticum]|uniref:Rhodopsin domain-containing protein n=1 Tax=Pyronema omphalodes (strain CBS 100304) TaxID=1076935 RepID=U4LKJ2_PYROM|nr:hypothetical protein FPQ18DRAFT_354393 [Pyronema domesticum]CCX13186.1 Similar to hypothetical protein [Tuber melanosporum Mel28]; acc. no. XP_002836882 [Pyronema omphalodes CBS 100304]